MGDTGTSEITLYIQLLVPQMEKANTKAAGYEIVTRPLKKSYPSGGSITVGELQRKVAWPIDNRPCNIILITDKQLCSFVSQIIEK